MPSSASPPCVPTTPTPTPTWPSLKFPGRSTTTPRPNLAKALALLPGDPRALYYRALVERNAGQIKEAIADLEAVLAKYPRSKDALREFGFSYFQQHDYPRARDAYERLQAVDPDDLAAHYQLAILYRRLGEKQKAAIESAKFADQKDDPTASTYALGVSAQASRSRQRIRRLAHPRPDRRRQAAGEDRVQVHSGRRRVAGPLANAVLKRGTDLLVWFDGCV